jgi:hypothetical protein
MKPMTEAKWLNSTDPQEMLSWLCRGGKANDRKLRLFACASCRRIWHLMTDPRSRGAVEVAERYADSLVTGDNLSATAVVAWAAAEGCDLSHVAGRAAGWVTSPEASEAASTVPDAVFDCLSAAVTITELAAHEALLRDLFDNPFRSPPAIASRWTNHILKQLAKAAYDERVMPAGTLDPARLGVLADALEETGCQNEDILGHLRGPGPHVRGCFVLDLLLGKS